MLRELSLRCPSPFIWFFFASWLTASAAVVEPEVLRLRARTRRQSAIFRSDGSVPLLPKPAAENSVASLDVAVDAEVQEEKPFPSSMVLLGAASLIFPILACLRPCRKETTIPLHHSYTSLPSEIIGGLAHSELATGTTSDQPSAPTQFFYIGDAPEAPTESEPEAELCPDAAPVVLPRLPQAVSLQTLPPRILPEPYIDSERSSFCAKRFLMLYASPLCRLDSRGPLPLPSLSYEKEWKTILKASEEMRSPATFAARPLTSGSLQRALRGGSILHLSAHGSREHLCLEDGKGSAHFLSLELLSEMFSVFRDEQLDLLVLNACHSTHIGHILAQKMPHVVCCEGSVLDSSAQLFMQTFYQAIFQGRSIAQAFSAAKIQLQCQAGLPKEAAECFCLLPDDQAHDDVIFPRRMSIRKPLRISSLPFEQLLPDLPEDFLGRTVDVWSILQHLSSRRLVAVCNETPARGMGKSTILDAVHRSAALHMQMRCVSVRPEAEDCCAWLLAIRSAVQMALAEEDWLSSAQRKSSFQPRSTTRRKCLPRRQLRRAPEDLLSVEELLDSLCHDIGLLALQWHKRSTAAGLVASSSRGTTGHVMATRNSGCDVLLVIHGCDQLLERQPLEMENALSTLLRHCPACVIFSCRSRMPGPGCGQFKVVHYELGGLRPMDAARLFLRRAQRPLRWKEVLSGHEKAPIEVDEEALVVLQKETEKEVLQFVASHPALQRLRGTPSALIKLASDLAHLTLPEARGYTDELPRAG